MAAQTKVAARGKRSARSTLARRARFAAMQERLQPRALDIAGLAAQLRQAAADARFEAIRPELDRIEVAGGKLSRLVADLTRKKSIDRLFANGDAMAAQEVLRERLRGPIKVIRDCGEILLEALPGLDGSSLRGVIVRSGRGIRAGVSIRPGRF